MRGRKLLTENNTVFLGEKQLSIFPNFHIINRNTKTQ